MSAGARRRWRTVAAVGVGFLIAFLAAFPAWLDPETDIPFIGVDKTPLCQPNYCDGLPLVELDIFGLVADPAVRSVRLCVDDQCETYDATEYSGGRGELTRISTRDPNPPDVLGFPTVQIEVALLDGGGGELAGDSYVGNYDDEYPTGLSCEKGCLGRGLYYVYQDGSLTSTDFEELRALRDARKAEAKAERTERQDRG